jgi:predicted acylesterase/phospholipase RssA
MERATTAASVPTPVSVGPPRALIMRGGGAKGLAYVGALLELEKYDFRFDTFVGTSAGAIAATLLAGGIEPQQLETILRATDFSTFLDSSILWIPWNLLAKQGCYEGKVLKDWVNSELQKVLRNETLPVLKELPSRVVLYATSRAGVEVFDSKGPNEATDAGFAARCSAGIPYVFTVQEHNGKRLYDGGVVNNFPVRRFANDNPGRDFVALFLGPRVELPSREKGSVLGDLLAAWLGQGEREELKKYRDRVIAIDPSPIGTLNFKLSNEEKEHLVLQGRSAALSWLVSRGTVAADDKYVREVCDRAEAHKKSLDRDRRIKRQRTLLAFLLAMMASGAIGTFVVPRFFPHLTGRALRFLHIGGTFTAVPPQDPKLVKWLPGDNPPDEFQTIRDISMWDLRGWTSVSTFSSPRTSPANFINYLHVRKKKTTANAYRAHYETQGSLIDAHCITHSSNLESTIGIAPLPTSPNHTGEKDAKEYDVVVDVSNEPVGKEFLIVIEATYWNGFQENVGKVTTYSDLDISGLEELAVFVLLPESRPLKHPWYTYRASAAAADTEVTFKKQSITATDQTGRFIYWSITDREPSHHYSINWKW